MRTSRGMSLMAGAVAASMAAMPLHANAATALIIPERPKMVMPAPPKRKRKRLGYQPNEKPQPFSSSGREPLDLSPAFGTSFKKLRRYYRANPDKIVWPTEQAKLRHPWYRRKVAMDALRGLVAA